MRKTQYKTINITIEEKELGFSLAKIIKGPMLIAWYDGIKTERTSIGA